MVKQNLSWFWPLHRYMHHAGQLYAILFSVPKWSVRQKLDVYVWVQGGFARLWLMHTCSGAHLRSPAIWIDEVSVFMLKCQCQGGTHGTFNSCIGTLPHELSQPTIHPLRVSKAFMSLDVRVLAHLHTYVIIMERTHIHDQRMSADIHMLSCYQTSPFP